MKPDSEKYSDAETAKRMDDALRRALSTPPKPHADMKKKPSPANGKAKKAR